VEIFAGDVPEKYNLDQYQVIDGKMLKGCDNLAAFLEAWLSIRYGITSTHLEKAVQTLPEQYKDKVISGIPFGKIYQQFC